MPRPRQAMAPQWPRSPHRPEQAAGRRTDNLVPCAKGALQDQDDGRTGECTSQGLARPGSDIRPRSGQGFIPAPVRGAVSGSHENPAVFQSSGTPASLICRWQDCCAKGAVCPDGCVAANFAALTVLTTLLVPFVKNPLVSVIRKRRLLKRAHLEHIKLSWRDYQLEKGDFSG
jgi:hypothetical protein